MVLKISELRQKYGLTPSFETEDEALAYHDEQQAAYEERVNAKVDELKAMYNSDKTKYEKFKNFTEEEWISYAKVCLKENTARQTKYDYYGLPSIDKNPENAQWAEFTYEEILQMESTGVLIPDEVLAWAHSMQDSDVTAYEINEDPNAAEETEETGENSENSELEKMQKKTLTLSNKSEQNEAQMTQKFTEFEEIAKKAEQVKREQETTKKDSLKQIEDLTKEWEEISTKVKNGQKLTDAEQNRYKELGSMLNGKDGELMTDLQASTDDLQDLINSMDGLSEQIKEGVRLGDETIDMAEQLANYEKGYSTKNVDPEITANVTTGDIKSILDGAKGQDIAKEALNNGNNLIEFSNTLSNQLMMNQYASLYDFAEIFTQTSNETIGNTKEVLGDDFNKTTEELNEQVDALPDMNNAEKDKLNLEQKGVGLIGQALYFAGKSSAESLHSVVSMAELGIMQKQSEKEQEQSQNLTDRVVSEMASKQEEADKLTEKKEKAEEKKQAGNDIQKSVTSIEDAEELKNASEENNSDEEFTEKDQQTLNRLNNELQTIGNFSQQKLYQSLSKIDGLEQLLQTQPLDGTNAVNYGEIAEQTGLELMSKTPPIYFFMYIFMIGALAYASGTGAQKLGKANNEVFEETGNITTIGKSSVGQNQISIQDTTKVEAINIVSAGQGENNSAQNGNNEATENAKNNSEVNKSDDSAETNSIEQNTAQENIQTVEENQKAQDTLTVGTSKEEAEIVNETTKEAAKDETPENGTKTGAAAPAAVNKNTGKEKADDEEEMSTDDAEKNVDSLQSKTEEENEDSLEKKAEGKKTEQQLEKEMKAVKKNIEKDQKEMEKIAKESQKIIQEKQQLAEEFEVLNAQNAEIIARQESSQNAAPAPAQGAQQGGLLSGSVQQNDMAVSGDDTSTLETNQSRIVTISSRFTALDKKLNVNQTKVRSLGSTTRKRNKTFEKLAREKEKIVKEHQKAEQKKQATVQKSLSITSIINNLFSITMSVGTILAAIPWTAALGATMITIGTYGMLACSVLKSTILMANGNFEQAFMTLGMAAIQIATSFIPGVGAASGAATTALSTTTQVIGAGLNIVSAAADTAAQGQTLAGKEQSGWLNTVSQVAGAASVLTNVAGGFANGKQVKLDAAGKPITDAAGKAVVETTKSAFAKAGTFGKVTQIAQAVGSAASTTAQISSLIKQANGEAPGKFENILNTIGFSISAAASVSQIGMKIHDAAKNKQDTTRSNEKQADEVKDDNKDTKKADKTDKTDKTDKADKTEENKKTEENDNQASDETTIAAETSVPEETEMSAEIEETIAKAEEAVETPESTIDAETEEQIKDAQSSETSQKADEEIEAARSAENEEQIEQTDKVQKDNVDEQQNETQTSEDRDNEIEAAAKTDEQSEQELSRKERREARRVERAERRAERKAARDADKMVNGAEQETAQPEEELDPFSSEGAIEMAKKDGSYKTVKQTIGEGGVIIEENIDITFNEATGEFSYNGKTYSQDELAKALEPVFASPEDKMGSFEDAVNELFGDDDLMNDLRSAQNTENNPAQAQETVEEAEQNISNAEEIIAEVSSTPDDAAAQEIIAQAEQGIAEAETVINEAAANETSVEEIPAANVNNETGTVDSQENPETVEIEASAETGNQSEQNPAKEAQKTEMQEAEDADLADLEEIADALGEDADISNIDKIEDKLDSTMTDEMKAKMDEEMKRALTPEQGEIQRPETTSEAEQAALKKQARQEKMDKIMDISSSVLSAGSQAFQAYTAIKGLTATEQTEERNVLHLSNMKKGKSLIRKIKTRRAALYGYTQS